MPIAQATTLDNNSYSHSGGYNYIFGYRSAAIYQSRTIPWWRQSGLHPARQSELDRTVIST